MKLKKIFKAIQNSHLYGRKLVFEWAKKENTLDEIRENTKRKLEVKNIEIHRKLNKSKFQV